MMFVKLAELTHCGQKPIVLVAIMLPQSAAQNLSNTQRAKNQTADVNHFFYLIRRRRT